MSKKGYAPVIVTIVDNYSRFRKTVMKIPVNRWDEEKAIIKLPPKNDKDFEAYVIMRDQLKRIDSEARQLFTDILIAKRNFTERDFLSLFPDSQKDSEKAQKTFFEALDLFIEMNKPIKAERTIKGYTTFKNYMTDFQKRMKYEVTWDSLDLHFIDLLQEFTFNVKQHEDSYFSRLTNTMKAFLHWASTRSYYVGDLHLTIKYEEPEKPIIFLTKKELFTFYEFEFSSARLNKSRDLFCFSAFTGLRYSDVLQLRKEHLRDGFIYKTQQKTKQVKTVPINKYAQSILDKYKDADRLLPVISSQKLNEYVKECCKAIAESDEGEKSFGEKVPIKKSVGGKVSEEYIPKYQAISYHVARKTFLTNSIMQGMSIPVLQEMGAPKRDKDLKKYIKLTDEYIKTCMNKAWE